MAAFPKRHFISDAGTPIGDILRASKTLQKFCLCFFGNHFKFLQNHVAYLHREGCKQTSAFKWQNSFLGICCTGWRCVIKIQQRTVNEEGGVMRLYVDGKSLIHEAQRQMMEFHRP